MKNTILHWTSVLLASSALLFAACSSDDDTNDGSTTTPVFPNLASLNIPVGETSCEISFTPNMDWTISIPTDAETVKWFELRDGEIKGTSFSGKASLTPITITVETTTQENFDETPVCEVSLTMGGQTQVIAKITRQNNIREFDLYLSKYDSEEDDFIMPYEYEETPLAKFDGTEAPESAPEGSPLFKWPIRIAGYMQVIKSSSNFNWYVSAPEWITVGEPTAIEDEAGSNQIFVNVNFDKLSEEQLDGAVALLDFYDANIDKNEDPGNSAHNRYCFELPAIRDLIRILYADQNAILSFNADGQYVSESLGSDETLYDNFSSNVSSTKGLKFYVLIPDGYGGYYSYHAYDKSNWITIEDTWDENGGVFQQHSYTITVKANSEQKRTATLVMLPPTIAAKIDETSNLDEQLLDTTSGSYDLKEEYKPYIYATIEQESANSGSEGGFSISYPNDAQYYLDNGYFKLEDLTNVDPNTDPDVFEYAGEIEMGAKLYRLTYNNSSMSEGALMLTLSGEYGMYMTMPYGNDWLVFYDASSGMVDTGFAVIGMSGEDLGSGQTGDKGSIVFYQGSTVVARIICIRNY